MEKKDLEELFSQVRAGDEVRIEADRTQETVSIFGGETLPVTVAQGSVVMPETAGQ